MQCVSGQPCETRQNCRCDNCKRYQRQVHFAAVQSGPNPITNDELQELIRRHPERWGEFAPKE